jgi:hypothetical protein
MFLTIDENRIAMDPVTPGEHQWGIAELSSQQLIYLATFEESTTDENIGRCTSLRTAMSFTFATFETYIQSPAEDLKLTGLYCISPTQKKTGVDGWVMDEVVQVLFASERSTPSARDINVFVTKGGKKWSDSKTSHETRHLLIGTIKYTLPQ